MQYRLQNNSMTREDYLQWAGELDIESIADVLQERDALKVECERLRAASAPPPASPRKSE